jgi:hypothetical protein
MCSGFPDPFAVATIGGEQTRTTGVIKKTLNPYWNESFDMYVSLYCFVCAYRKMLINPTGAQRMRAYWQFRSLTRRSSRKRTRASSESSTCALAACLTWTLAEMVSFSTVLRSSQVLTYIQRCSLETSESRTITSSSTASSFSTFRLTFAPQLITRAQAQPDHHWPHLELLQMAHTPDLRHQQEHSHRHHYNQIALPVLQRDSPLNHLALHLRRLTVPQAAELQGALGSAPSKTLKEGFLVAGKDVRITLEEHITWITTHGRLPGFDRPPTMTPASKEPRCSNNRMWRDRGIRHVCCRKIGQAPTRQPRTATRPLKHPTR